MFDNGDTVEMLELCSSEKVPPSEVEEMSDDDVFVKKWLESKPEKCEACGSVDLQAANGNLLGSEAYGIKTNGVSWVCANCGTAPSDDKFITQSRRLRNELTSLIEQADSVLEEFNSETSDVHEGSGEN